MQECISRLYYLQVCINRLYYLQECISRLYYLQVFESCADELVSRALDGYSGTVMAFGQTGAGKTYTITGPGQSYRHRGLLPRLIHGLYQEIENRCEQEISVRASYLEIYNEVLYDLLGPVNEGTGDRLVVTEESGVVGAKGLSVRVAKSEEDALNFLFEGDMNRCIGEHKLNRLSSRYGQWISNYRH